jgi:nucleoside diphosphate kinase
MDDRRARFGTNAVLNAIHVSASVEDADREMAFLLSPERSYVPEYTHCSALLIRPHAVRAKETGKIVQQVLDSGLEISALRSCAMEGQDIEDYLEAYKGASCLGRAVVARASTALPQESFPSTGAG